SSHEENSTIVSNNKSKGAYFFIAVYLYVLNLILSLCRSYIKQRSQQNQQLKQQKIILSQSCTFRCRKAGLRQIVILSCEAGFATNFVRNFASESLRLG
ncbi:MAG: hypothetical protein J6X22_04700, partial [Muribaculaceae bacterium]|nr:hypothetical protein [Muribaculaceae bacterium]